MNNTNNDSVGRLYALAALASPIISAAAVLLWQYVTTDPAAPASANGIFYLLEVLQWIAQLVQLLLGLLAGCVLGLGLSVLSLQSATTSRLGYVSLLLNGLASIALLAVFLEGYFSGI